MAVKELLARVQHKRDTSANWEAQDPVLLDGEIIIVDTTDGKSRTKTGDGQKNYSQLPFDDEALYKAISTSSGNSVPYNRVLTVSGWVNNRQVVTIDELTAEQNGIAGLSQDISTTELEATEAAAIYACGQEDGKLIFALGGDKPTCDIPIVIILLK